MRQEKLVIAIKTNKILQTQLIVKIKNLIQLRIKLKRIAIYLSLKSLNKRLKRNLMTTNQIRAMKSKVKTQLKRLLNKCQLLILNRETKRLKKQLLK